MKKFYPYTILDRSQFNHELIPIAGITERIEFFYKYKRTTENLYIGDIDKSHLLLRDSVDLLNPIKQFFQAKHYLQDNSKSAGTNHVFPKICWLAYSFLKNGFTHPIAVHYNPRIQQNVVHPGTARGHIIKLFHNTTPINCLYFNTGGVDFDFLKSMQLFDKDKLLENNTLEFQLVADHCSIIPHINLDAFSVSPNTSTWQQFIHQRLQSSSFTVFSNIDVLKPWYASEKDASIQIYFNNELLIQDMPGLICKALILAIIGKSFASDTLIVNHKVKVDPPKTVIT